MRVQPRIAVVIADLLTIFLLTPNVASAQSAAPSSYVLIGNIPGRYVKGASKKAYAVAAVTVENGVITAVERVSDPDTYQNAKQLPTIVLRRPNAPDLDAIYPGLFNLHNHTKQNVLSVWADAQGQFANRFEWRAWSNYKGAVSGNMNPWIGYGAPVTCAAFRLSEVLAASLGTT
jgi:hypothetical protein